MTNDATTDATADGFLAIWSDVAPAIETDYLHWLTREHAQERLGVPGFLSVRVFRALRADIRRYFILYRLREAGVVGSPDYLARLNAPTPWSRRIMPQLQNFARGGGRRLAQFGSGDGGTIAALRFDAALSAELRAAAERLAALDRVAAVRFYETDAARTAIPTGEKGMRAQGAQSGDASFASLVVVEALDEPALRRAVAALPAAAGDAATATAYAAIFALDAGAVRATG